MRIRLFGHYWQAGVVLLWILESVTLFCGGWITLRLADEQDSAAWSRSLVLSGCIVVAAISMGLFSSRLRDRTTGIVMRIGVAVFIGTAVGAFLLFLLQREPMNLVTILYYFSIALISLSIVRIAAHRLVDEDKFKRRVLVYGAGRSAGRVAQLRRRSDQRGFKVIGFVPSPNETPLISEDRLLVATEGLARLAESNQIDEIVVAMDDKRQQFPLKQLLECRLAGIDIVELATFLERETGKVYLDILVPSWMIFGDGFRRDFLRRYSERAFDVAASFVLLLLTLPVMALTVLAIKLEEGLSASIIYGQPRVGYAGRVFRVRKFRSMREDAEKDGRARWATANDDRVTRVGRFIRKVRIDELPQLFNVLGGSMSFVGPRPERPEFVRQLIESIPYYEERHAVKPGITGWAQLCYPYGASEQDAIEKLQFDLYYVKNHSLLLDIVILLQTVEVVLFGKGR